MRRFALVLTAGLAAVPCGAQDLSGVWRDDGEGRYLIRHSGDELCWSLEAPQVRNVFCGTVIGSSVVGGWLDLPGGDFYGGGRLILKVESGNRMVKTYQSGDYGASVWTREGSTTSRRSTTGPDVASPPPSRSPTSVPAPAPARAPDPPAPPAHVPGTWRLVAVEQGGPLGERPRGPGEGDLRFDVLRFDASGGEALATITMGPQSCPVFESESILFRWSFGGDIRTLRPGDEIPISVAMEPRSQSARCPTASFPSTEVVVAWSGHEALGATSQLGPLWSGFTTPYVRNPAAVRFNFYVGGAASGSAALHVGDAPPGPTDSRRGAFGVTFTTGACCSTGRGRWAFRYVYEY